MSSVATQYLAGLLERSTGQQLLPDRHWRIDTALKPVMRAHDLTTLGTLAAAIAQAPGGPLAEEAVEALLNHETSFFRDPEPFRALIGTAFDWMRRQRSERRLLRIWSAGCATGQELYSVAMAIGGEPARWADWQVSLTGTDISHRAIARANAGLYTHFEAQRGLPVTALVRSFEPEGDAWRIKPELRARARFRRHNLLDAAPGGGLDVILCRNVLLYFAPEQQCRVLARLREALAGDGILMLGAGETLPAESDDFRAHPDLKGFYRAAA